MDDQGLLGLCDDLQVLKVVEFNFKESIILKY